MVISNISAEMAALDWFSYTYSTQNAEVLLYADNSFDYIVIHEASPHRVLTEMCRVAKKGVMVKEG